MRNSKRLIIVGGGFSGVALAVSLLRVDPHGLRITLLESGDRVGRGLAYGTTHASHLLNTRAAQMSIHPDDPEHFVRFCRARGMSVQGDDFVPRRLYGEYLEHSLAATAQASARASLEVLVNTVVEDVVPIERGGFAVVLPRGLRLEADAVVLATGHGPPAEPLRGLVDAEETRYLRDPWEPTHLARIGPDDRVLVLGTGLTAVDVAFTLEQQGHRGHIRLLSRHGLLPQAHQPLREILPRDSRAELFADVTRNDLRGMVTALRRACCTAAERGQGWHAVLDALRPVTPRIWAQLCAKDRGRFLRCLRPYWDAHRHRLPPVAAERIAALRASGRLSVAAGRVRSVASRARELIVDFVPRGARRAVREYYDWIVNCTGNSFARDESRPLERRLLCRGLLLVDPLALGYVTSDNGVAIGRHGPIAGFYVLGPACRANWWEHTAAPEIRVQAEALAAELLVAGDAPRWLPTPVVAAALAQRKLGSPSGTAGWSIQR